MWQTKDINACWEFDSLYVGKVKIAAQSKEYPEAMVWGCGSDSDIRGNANQHC